MPKRHSSLSPHQDYASDDGFVEDAPRSKKAKTSSTKTSTKTSSKTTSKSQPKPAAQRQSDDAAAGGGVVGKDGEIFWELSGKRRVGLQEFKGKVMVNVREYYEKEGEMLPGKKGISLPMDQFNTLVTLLPQIEKALADKGERIGRPDYSGEPMAAADEDDGDEEEQEPEAKAKKNFEETSDEE